nr:MAG TPA: hypothetical protein [Caudoviricetes sp.]
MNRGLFFFNREADGWKNAARCVIFKNKAVDFFGEM